MTIPALPPFPVFTDAAGIPLQDGYVYIGTANTNPITNPITVYWDEAGTQPAAQPIRTINGYMSRNGSPGVAYASANDFSILVRDKNSRLVFASPRSLSAGLANAAFAQSIIDNYAAVRLLNSSTHDATSINVSGYADPCDGGEGQFVYDPADLVSSDNDGTILVDASGRRWKREYSGGLNVRWFGAPNNGVDDATAGIQAAVDYAYSANKPLVWFPAGTYSISARIRAKRYVTCQGEGAYSKVLQTADTDAFVFDESVEGVLGREIKFLDLFITKQTKTATVCYGIRLRGTTNNIWGAVIKGCTVSKFYRGCNIIRPIVTLIERNEWEDNYEDGCRIEGDGTSVTYVNNWGRANGGYGLRVIGQLTYSHFDTPACDGNTLGGYFFGKDGSALWPFAITLTNPGAEANTGDGLKIEDGENFTINGGYMYLNGGDGMEFTGARGVVCNGTKFLTNTGWQVRASTSSTPKVPSNIVLNGCSLSASGLGRISDTTIVSEVLSPDNSNVRFARPVDCLTIAQNGVTIMNGTQVLQNLGVGSTTYHWIKQVINYTDLAAAALTANFNLTQTVPDASYIVDCVFQLNTEFSGGAVASATIQIGDTGVSNRYIPATNVFTGAGVGYKATNVTDRGVGLYDAVTRSLRHPVFTGVRTLRVTLTTTGANTNALTAGQITVWFGIIKLP